MLWAKRLESVEIAEKNLKQIRTALEKSVLDAEIKETFYFVKLRHDKGRVYRRTYKTL